MYCMSVWIHLLQHAYIIDFETYFMIPSSTIQVWHFRPNKTKKVFPLTGKLVQVWLKISPDY